MYLTGSYLDGLKPFDFVVEIVVAIIAVAVVAEIPICKAVTVPVRTAACQRQGTRA